MPDAHEAVDNGRRLALDHGRADLAEGLDAARKRWQQRTLPVAVVGEFKRGKSTLVNALLQTAVCPVDADVVTALPTFVRYGERPGATAFYDSDDGTARGEDIAVDARGRARRREPSEQRAVRGRGRWRSGCGTGCCVPGCAWWTRPA